MKYLSLILLIFAFSCTTGEQQWTQTGTIDLGETTPIGLTMQGENLWVADGDHNRLVEISLNGEVQQSIEDFERPMHITEKNGVVYIPEYGSDNIIQLKNGNRTVLEIPDSLDAPAGVDMYNNEIAIADFYNHRVLFFDGKKWMSIGKEGKAKGELYYPTDITIGEDKIFVADAYNNRVQIFDKKGNSLQLIGETEKLNAATGIFANTEEIIITDFENNRVLVYNHEGEVKQILSKEINKPTDILIENGTMYIANYKGKNINIYKK